MKAKSGSRGTAAHRVRRILRRPLPKSAFLIASAGGVRIPPLHSLCLPLLSCTGQAFHADTVATGGCCAVTEQRANRLTGPLMGPVSSLWILPSLLFLVPFGLGGRVLRVLSGIQPSGRLHIGNYFGAMRQHLHLQAQHESFYFIADYHALTSNPAPGHRPAHARRGDGLRGAGPGHRQDRLLAAVGHAGGDRAGVAAVLRNPDGAAAAVRQLQGQGRPGPERQPRAVRLSGPPGGRHPDLPVEPRARRGRPEAAHRGDPRHRHAVQQRLRRGPHAARRTTSSSRSPSSRAPTGAR
jgi:hypothetical protein